MIDWNTGSMGDTDLGLLTPENAVDVAQFERVVVTRPRPALLVNERELSVLRRGLTKDGWKRSLYLQPIGQCHGAYLGAGLLSLANKWLEYEPAHPEWHSDLRVSCCKCGEQLVLPCDNNEACDSCEHPVGGARLTIPAWQAQAYRLASAALSLAVVYGIEKDKAYADKAVQVMIACAEAYANAPQGTEVTFDAKCMVAIAQAYDLIYYSRCMGEEDKEQLEQQFMTPVARDIAAQSRRGAPGAWRLSAMGLIGLAIRDYRLVQQAVNELVAWLGQLGDDALVEGSLGGDHFESLSALVHFSEACYRCGINLYTVTPEPNKCIRAMFTAPLRYAYPSFRLPAAGNSTYNAFIPLELYEVAYRRWGDAELAWVLKKGYSFAESPLNDDHVAYAHRFIRTSFYAFMFGRDLPGRSAVLSPKSRALSSQGLASLRNSSSMMASVACGWNGEGRHCDALGFTLYANNRLLAPDFGAPAEPDNEDGWHAETWAHNTVVVDGQSHKPEGYWALVSHCLGADFQGARFVLEECYPGVTHRRTLMLIGDVCVLSDVLESEREHTYDWLLKCEAQPQLAFDYPSGSIPGGLHPLIEAKSTFKTPGPVSIRWTTGEKLLSHYIWSGPGQAEGVIATCPAESLDRRVPMVICRQNGSQAEFVSVFVQTSPSQDCLVTRNGGTLVVSAGDRVDYIQSRALGEDDNQIIKTDAQFAGVRTNNGTVQSIMLSGGSRLEWNGQLMLESPSAVDCLEATFDGHGPQIRYAGGKPGILQLRTNARATRVNGYRATTSNVGGMARLRVTQQMLDSDPRHLM